MDLAYNWGYARFVPREQSRLYVIRAALYFPVLVLPVRAPTTRNPHYSRSGLCYARPKVASYPQITLRTIFIR